MDKNKEFNFDEIQRALEEKVQEPEAPRGSGVSEKSQGTERELNSGESQEMEKEYEHKESQETEKECEHKESPEMKKEREHGEAPETEKEGKSRESRKTEKEEREGFRKRENVDEERESEEPEGNENFREAEGTEEFRNNREIEEREALRKSEEAAAASHRGMSVDKDIPNRRLKPDQKESIPKQRRYKEIENVDETIEAKEILRVLSQGTRAALTHVGGAAGKLWRWREKKWVRLTGIGLVIIIALFSVTQAVKYWSYDNYTVQTDFTGEDTTAASYRKVEDQVLKYSLDGAVLSDSSGTVIWTNTYNMNAPAVDNCGDTVLIYDTQGTNMRIYQESGEIGNISTELPIIKAKVAKQGVTAAILEAGENTWIQYYDTSGASIASFKTTLDSPGYPLDLALSEDGLLMAVSYLQIDNGIPKTKIGFYNWSSIGQNQMDNMVNSYTLEDSIAPQVEYLDADTCIVLREDGFTVYEGKQIPKQAAEVEEEKEIISVFYNNNCVGMVVRSDDSQNSFTMKVYNLNGRELFTEDFNFNYEQIVMDDELILMYNSNQMCVYSLAGVKKFEGDIKEGALNNVLPLNMNRYMIVTEKGTCTIKLK